MDETKPNNLASLLRDFAQGASNSVAGNVAVPVDAIAWLLRKGGVNVPSNPVMGSDWMAEKGLTREPQNKLAGLVGDMAGMVTPFAAAAKAPQIARGLLASGEGAATAGKWLGKEALRPVNDAILYGEGPLRKILPESPKIFIGQNAKNFDKNNLAQALKMEKEGVDPRQIWSETGSMKAPWDKQWRQEIDDSAANINFGTGQIDSLMNHPDFFGSYPEIGKTHSMVNPSYIETKKHGRIESIDPNGMYAHKTDTTDPFIHITGRDSGDRSAKSIALHELQHAIQGREGFASGGSIGEFGKQANAVNARDALSWAKELKNKYKDMKGADVSALDNAVAKEYESLGAADFIPSRDVRELARQPYVLHPEHYPDSGINDLNNLIKDYGLDKRVTPYTDMEAYRRLAGEAEARAVQARMNMDAGQRRATYPLDSFDVPVDQLITRFGDTPAMSQGNERLLKILERNGESIAPKTKFKYPIGDRDILAQQRAALPLPPAGVDITKLPQAEARQYGLGLRADNTALERANASKEADSIFDMNFNNDVYHGGSSDIRAPSYDFSGKGHDQYGSAALYTATNPTLASGYAEKALEGANVMPLRINTKGFVSDTNVPNLTATQIAEMIKKSPDKDAIYNFGDVDYEGLNKVIGNAVKEYKSVNDDGLSQLNMLSNDFYPNNPAEFNKGISKLTGIRGVTADVGAGEKFYMPWHEDDIRSRFAAFDPWRRNAAIAAAMGVAAPDLLAKDNNELASILKSKK